jgi:hypothetical protein
MTDRTPDERYMRGDDDEPEVEAHKLRSGPEEPSDPGRYMLNEDADEGPDVEGHRYH